MNHIDKLVAPYPPLSKRETQFDIDAEQNGWLGEIPKRWVLKKAKYLFCQRFEKGNSKNLELLTPSQHFGVIPQTMLEELTSQVVVKIGEKVDLRSFKGIHPGDFCISLRSFQGGFEYCKYEGVVSSAYTVFYPIVPIADGYYRFLFKSKSFIERMNAYTMSLRDGKNIPFEDFAETFIPYPPLDEQEEIARFLDKKCAEIDALSSKIREEIILLQNSKNAFIRESVFGGLDRGKPMIDSGIDWVGCIPSDWMVRPLSLYFGERKNINSLSDETNLLSLSYGKVVQRDINATGGLLPMSFSTYNIVEPDDIIIRPTDLQNDQKSLRTGLCKEHGIITSAYIALYRIAEIDAGFAHYVLHAYDIEKVFYNMGSGVRQGLGFDVLKKLKIPVPPLGEQEEIAQYLDEKCAEIDAIIEGKEKQLDVLDSYKKSLIYEYVTGKKVLS